MMVHSAETPEMLLLDLFKRRVISGQVLAGIKIPEVGGGGLSQHSLPPPE